jgi:hypothetical protein
LSPKYKRSDGEEYVCLTLQLSRSSLRYDTVVQAVFKFFVYDQIYRKHAEQQGRAANISLKNNYVLTGFTLKCGSNVSVFPFAFAP